MTSYVTPKKGAELIFYIGLVSQSTGQFQSNPTLAAGDFKVSIDGGALNNLATLPAVTPASSKSVKVTLSTSEMNGDNIIMIGSDAAGAEWDDIFVNIQTTVQQIDDLATSSALANVQSDTDNIQTRLPAALVSGRMDSSVGAMAANTLTASALAADAVTEIQSGLATSAALATVQADTDDIQTRLPAALTADGNIKADTLRVGGTLQTAGDIIGDTNDIQTRLPAALSGDGFMKADILSINDELTNGYNATFKLKQLDIQNNAGTAMKVYSTGSNGTGLDIQGHEIGPGMVVTAGASSTKALLIDGNELGHGLEISGGATQGSAIYGYANATDYNGLELYSGGGGGRSIFAQNDIAVSDGDLTLAAIASAVWANATRTLTSISDSAGITTLLSRIGGALNIAGGKVDANVKQVNDTDLTGDGSIGTPWGPA